MKITVEQLNRLKEELTSKINSLTLLQSTRREQINQLNKKILKQKEEGSIEVADSINALKESINDNFNLNDEIIKKLDQSLKLSEIQIKLSSKTGKETVKVSELMYKEIESIVKQSELLLQGDQEVPNIDKKEDINNDKIIQISEELDRGETSDSDTSFSISDYSSDQDSSQELIQF